MENQTELKTELVFNKIDIASGNPQALAAFYSDVFNVEFKEITETIQSQEWKLYLGELGGLKLFICPAETSGTQTDQPGVHQFHLHVSNVGQLVKGIREKGHSIESVPFGESKENYCLRDPDGHPWILSSPM